MNQKPYDVRSQRLRYELERVAEHGLDLEPMRQFSAWLQEAADAGVTEPNAMSLATADPDGRPRVRTVLLRGLDDGFIFYTNYNSPKGKHLAANPQASACFAWLGQHRQVIVEGTVTKLSAQESDDYFASRPVESQIASAASPQSQPVDLDRLLAEIDRLAADNPRGIARPSHWGGYRLTPQVIEFWQGNVGRLHDRFRYRRDGEGWHRERLAP